MNNNKKRKRRKKDEEKERANQAKCLVSFCAILSDSFRSNLEPELVHPFTSACEITEPHRSRNTGATSSFQ